MRDVGAATPEPRDPPSRVADAAMRAAKRAALAEGRSLKEAVVLVRLDNDRAATAGHRDEGDADAEWLATELLYRLDVVLTSMGKLNIGFIDEPGQG